MPQSDPRPGRDRDEDAKPSAARKRTPSPAPCAAPGIKPGTAASGNASTPALPAVKQTAKTDAERGGQRR